jgi:hypothetical protein
MCPKRDSNSQEAIAHGDDQTSEVFETSEVFLVRRHIMRYTMPEVDR